MKINAIFFDVDDTLYDSTLQVDLARKNAIKAMIEAGLDVSEEEAMNHLQKIVGEYGSNYEYHFNRLLEDFNGNTNPRIIAAGIVSYHTTKMAHLVPFADTIPTLMKLRELGYKIGVITDGRAVKQWEKLIRLGLQHFFHAVIISEDIGQTKPDEKIFRRALKIIGTKANETIMVGDRIDRDILGANKAGMTTIQILKGKYRNQKQKSDDEKPDYIISNLKEILDILKKDGI